MAWYKQWTGKDANENKDNIKHIFDELQGKIDHERIGRNDSRPGLTPNSSQLTLQKTESERNKVLGSE
jgi:hypothetical protein